MRVFVGSIVASFLTLTACGSDGSGSLAGGPNGDGSGASSDSGSSGTSPGASSDLSHCLSVLNAYRAKVGAPPLGESSALDTFAAAGAQSDSQSGQAHGHFKTQGSPLVAFAENEIPGWPLGQYGSVSKIIDEGMQMMFNEGPGGGHYDNMTSTHYTQAGCGIFVTSSNAVWVTTDFR
jgi:uncharacterized protein YkwD